MSDESFLSLIWDLLLHDHIFLINLLLFFLTVHIFGTVFFFYQKVTAFSFLIFMFN